MERAKRKPTESLDAYDYYLRAMARFHHWTQVSVDEALRLFDQATKVDPYYASAYGMAAMCYAQRKWMGWAADRQHEIAETTRLAHLAAQLGRDDAVALSSAGYALARIAGNLDEGVAFLEQALALNRNLAQAWYCIGHVKVFCGQPDAALESLRHAMRLSPIDPLMFLMLSGAAFAHLTACRYDEASAYAKRALREKPNHHPALRVVAASHALTGRMDDANKAMTRMRQLNPALRVSDLGDLIPFRRKEDLAKYVEGLRKAGLPE
jgi:tetratricopeptide (TPR) repeat protein